MIIEEQELLKDSLSILTEHFEISEFDAKQILNENEISEIIELMWETQEQYISKIASKYFEENMV